MTTLEQAIRDTRGDLVNYLRHIDKISAFDDFTKEDILGLIRVAHDGVSIRNKTAMAQGGADFPDSEIPF